jgi:hypothetical protein
MAAAARFHAKSPTTPFVPDTDAKRRATTDAIAKAVEGRLADVHRRLEQLRGGG